MIHFAIANEALDKAISFASGPDAETVALHRGVPETRLANIGEITQELVGIRDDGNGQAEAFLLEQPAPTPIDPKLLAAVNIINEGKATGRHMAFVMGHPAFPKVRKRLKNKPSDAEKELKRIAVKIDGGTETATDRRRALRLLIGEAEQ